MPRVAVGRAARRDGHGRGKGKGVWRRYGGCVPAAGSEGGEDGRGRWPAYLNGGRTRLGSCGSCASVADTVRGDHAEKEKGVS